MEKSSFEFALAFLQRIIDFLGRHAVALGYDVERYKIMAFVLSAGLAGLGAEPTRTEVVPGLA